MATILRSAYSIIAGVNRAVSDSVVPIDNVIRMCGI